MADRCVFKATCKNWYRILHPYSFRLQFTNALIINTDSHICTFVMITLLIKIQGFDKDPANITSPTASILILAASYFA